MDENEILDLIDKLSQDITWDDDLIIEQDDLFDSERDVYNIEEEGVSK